MKKLRNLVLILVKILSEIEAITRSFYFGLCYIDVCASEKLLVIYFIGRFFVKVLLTMITFDKGCRSTCDIDRLFIQYTTLC